MTAIIAGIFSLLWAIVGLPLRPGVQIQELTSAPPRSSPTNTGVWFVTGLSDQGRTDAPVLIRSMIDFVTYFGPRVAYSVLYDALDTFFHEGGGVAYVARVVGPGATKATKNLLDGVAATSLTVNAIGPGASYANYKVAVIAGTVGGTYQIQILDINNNILENSPNLTTQQDAVTWAQGSNYVRIVIGASANAPVVVAAAVLVGGNDDRASIVDAQWLAALNLFTKDLGPGNVSAPGRTTDVGHTQLADHAMNNNRVAFLDLTDTAVAATLQTSAANAKATGNGQYAASFAPWLVVPGFVPGTTRTVPPSALVAGATAKVDPVYGPGMPAAGAKGVSSFATAVSQASWDDTTRDALNTAGVNVIRWLNGTAVIYGFRSLADPINNPSWLSLGTVRYLMGLAARSWLVGQQYVFAQIDGQGHSISAYGGALKSLLSDDFSSGQIYGQTPADAYSVDVGPAVNTPAVLAGNELRANISVRPSPMAELVTIQIVNTPITQAVA